MSEKPELVLTRPTHREPLVYRCAECGRSFLIPADQSPEEGATELWAAFDEHVRKVHATAFQQSKEGSA